MHARFLAPFPLLLAGCVSFTTSGTREAVLFSGKEAAAENARAVLTPYDDLPLSLEFACPDRLATLSTFYVIPLPPVVPAGFLNRKRAYLRIRMPEGTEDAMARTRIVTPQGGDILLSALRQARRPFGRDGTLEATYVMDTECKALDGGKLEVAGFFYRDKHYPAAVARLRFDAAITAGVGWWPPAMLHRGPADDGGGLFSP